MTANFPGCPLPSRPPFPQLLPHQSSLNPWWQTGNAGIAIGREKRKTLDSKLDFYQGPEVSAQLGLATLGEDNANVLISAGFGWVLGLQHSFNERWAVNLETIPGLSLVGDFYGEDSSGLSSVGFNARFNNFVSIGLVRKF